MAHTIPQKGLKMAHARGHHTILEQQINNKKLSDLESIEFVNGERKVVLLLL